MLQELTNAPAKPTMTFSASSWNGRHHFRRVHMLFLSMEVFQKTMMQSYQLRVLLYLQYIASVCSDIAASNFYITNLVPVWMISHLRPYHSALFSEAISHFRGCLTCFPFSMLYVFNNDGCPSYTCDLIFSFPFYSDLVSSTWQEIASIYPWCTLRVLLHQSCLVHFKQAAVHFLR